MGPRAQTGHQWYAERRFPIPCSYTSLQLDGAARNYLCLIYMDTQDHVLHCVWIHLFSYLLRLRREEKQFGLSWNQTQVILFHK